MRQQRLNFTFEKIVVSSNHLLSFIIILTISHKPSQIAHNIVFVDSVILQPCTHQTANCDLSWWLQFTMTILVDCWLTQKYSIFFLQNLVMSSCNVWGVWCHSWRVNNWKGYPTWLPLCSPSCQSIYTRMSSIPSVFTSFHSLSVSQHNFLVWASAQLAKLSITSFSVPWWSFHVLPTDLNSSYLVFSKSIFILFLPEYEVVTVLR